MRLLKLTLRNFKGVRDFTLDCNGESVAVYGANATGKTTLKDAVMFLLFGKNSEDKRDFNIKTIVDGEEMHGAEHIVEGVFFDNGRQIALKKIYKEKWNKPKGKLEAEFSGHTTEHYIDDVPKSATEYTRFIGSIVDEKVFKMLTDPLYFNEKVKKEERRKILMDIAGGITDDEVIASAEELKDLPVMLNGKSVDDFKLVVKQSLSKTQKKIEGIEPAIAENQRNLVEVTESRDVLAAGLQAVQDEIAALSAQKATLKNDDAVAELKSRLQEAHNELSRLRFEQHEMFHKEKGLALDALNAVKSEVSKLGNSLASLKSRRGIVSSDIAVCVRKREQLVAKFKATDEREFEGFAVETVCPTCGQELLAEKVAEAKDRFARLKEDFNLKKAEALKSINAEGIANNDLMAARQEELADLDLQIEDVDLAYVAKKAEADEKEKAVGAIAAPATTDEMKALEDKVLKINEAIAAPDEALIAATEKLDAQVGDLREKEQSLQACLADHAANEKALKRIEELKAEEQKLSAMYTDLTRMLYLADEFTRRKTEILNSKISGLFKIARFKMFENNITNDGIKEDCEVMVDGVPYSDLNNAKRVNVGIDIINALSEKYGVDAPIIFDNAESVTDLISTEAQVISLVVSAEDKKLRVAI